MGLSLFVVCGVDAFFAGFHDELHLKPQTLGSALGLGPRIRLLPPVYMTPLYIIVQAWFKGPGDLKST